MRIGAIRGRRGVRAEEIYDAAVDDGAFAHLATTLAHAIGARSGVLHWRDEHSGAEEISYSGYFSAAQMADFDREFSGLDLWSTAVNLPDNVNRVWDCEDLVPPATYEASSIYNEWIRPMGDDTFRAVGGVIRSGGIVGEMGFHRGRGQAPFSAAELHQIREGFGHLSRMFALRSRLSGAARVSADLNATLDAVGDAIFTLQASGRIIHHNLAAEQILRRGDGLLLHNHKLKAQTPGDDNCLQIALKKAVAAPGAEATALFVSRPSGAPYCLSVTSVMAGAERQIVILINDPDARDASLANRLRTLYGLTRAEAEVVQRLCDGATLDRLSEERGVVRATIRTQLKAIYGKLDCNRQSELVAKVRSIPALGHIS